MKDLTERQRLRLVRIVELEQKILELELKIFRHRKRIQEITLEICEEELRHLEDQVNLLYPR